MARNGYVPRPTEDAAVKRCPDRPASVSPERLADLLIEAREAGDRFGARHFDHLLDRALSQG